MDEEIEEIYRSIYAIDQELNSIRSILSRIHARTQCEAVGLDYPQKDYTVNATDLADAIKDIATRINAARTSMP